MWAADNGNPRLESLGPSQVSVFVQKQNLFSPKFSQDSYTAKVHLPTIPGVEVVCVSSQDPDDVRGRNNSLSRTRYVTPKEPTKLEYFLKEDDEPELNYRLDKDSGCLYVNEVDLTKGKYKLVVTVTDGTFSSSTDVFIFVDDALENSLKFTQNRYFAHVLENSTKHMNLLIVKVDDLPLNHHVKYSILNPNQYLTVGSTSGVIQATGVPLDREIKDHFSIIIQVSCVVISYYRFHVCIVFHYVLN